MSGGIPPLPQYAFMAWCSVKRSTGTTLASTFTFHSTSSLALQPFVCSGLLDDLISIIIGFLTILLFYGDGVVSPISPRYYLGAQKFRVMASSQMRFFNLFKIHGDAGKSNAATFTVNIFMNLETTFNGGAHTFTGV
jgi:hypothetical protein